VVLKADSDISEEYVSYNFRDQVSWVRMSTGYRVAYNNQAREHKKNGQSKP
jgi:hypothetical protein